MRTRPLHVARIAAAIAVLACWSVRTQAQRRHAVGAHVVVSATSVTSLTSQAPPPSRVPRLFLPDDDARAHPAPSWAPAASLVVPGAGQAAMRQTRGVAYIAAEAYAWVQALEFRREENRRRANYRRTAREVARAPFGAVRDTSWEYYEALEERESSGRYNLTPNGPLTPETDTSTYNGNQWLRIRELRFSNPDEPITTTDPRYQQALQDYLSVVSGLLRPKVALDHFRIGNRYMLENRWPEAEKAAVPSASHTEEAAVVSLKTGASLQGS